MPPRGAPIDTELLILFELARGGPGHGPLLLRRVRDRLDDDSITLHYGTYYPALQRLTRKELVSWTLQLLPWMWHKKRNPKVYVLTEKGVKEVRRFSAMFHRLILPP